MLLDPDALAEMMAGIIEEHVAKAVEPLNARIAALEERKPEPGPPGEKGEKGDPGENAPAPSLEAVWSEIQPQAEQIIAEAVSRAVEALPPPEKGEKGDRGEKGDPGTDGRDGADGLPGKDGASIVAPVKDNGELCFTLDNGQILRTGIRDGEKGADGRDGFSLDDYDEWFEDAGRTLVRRFVRGDDFKEFRHQTALPRYLGGFKEGAEYTPGDLVTFGGSMWHCDEPTKEKPGTASWTIAAKKGRDGKDAK